MIRLAERPSVARRLGMTGAIGMALVLFAGCGVPDDPEPTPRETEQTEQDPQPAPEPSLMPEGTARDNLPLFTRVVEQIWQSEERAHGRAYVDALAAAGFDKAAMEVTPDESTVGNPAESLLFSVRWGEECLIGQVGPETGEPVTMVDRVLDGRCLVGETRPIDW